MGTKLENISAYNQDQSSGGVKDISSPRHTLGHVCLLFEDVLFAGDVVENKKGLLMPYPSGWNWNTPVLMDSIGKVSRYPFKWVCPPMGNRLKGGRLVG
jgi:glyoxylase-like metal-dependent hydrolase (beta-lactamase superfamily II)